MLMIEKGINWNDLESKLKRGTYVKRIITSKPFTADELKDLPPMHQAHKNPNLIIERSIITEIEYPIFSKIGNKEDVIFYDADPISNVSDAVSGQSEQLPKSCECDNVEIFNGWGNEKCIRCIDCGRVW